MGRTLLFCTSWAGTIERWDNVYGRWLDYYAGNCGLLAWDHVLLIDDASPLLPADPRIEVIHEAGWPGELPEIALYRFTHRLGRSGKFVFPGWWRSFLCSLDFAKRYAFDRIVHCESDAFVLSRRLAEHINALDRDWTSLWCPRYNCPESAIQVLCADQYEAMETMRVDGIDALAGVIAELELPFSNIETQWIGDRYGEYRKDIPPEADYACQVTQAMALPR